MATILERQHVKATETLMDAQARVDYLERDIAELKAVLRSAQAEFQRFRVARRNSDPLRAA